MITVDGTAMFRLDEEETLVGFHNPSRFKQGPLVAASGPCLFRTRI